MATWRDACPLQLMCTECGLDVECSAVRAHARHPWLLEGHWRHQPLRRLLQTIRRAASPRRFWRDVHITEPIHLGPTLLLSGLVVLLSIVTITAACVLSNRSAAVFHVLGREFVVGQGPLGVRWLDLILLCGLAELEMLLRLLPGPVLALSAMPLAFAAVPFTLRRARVRRGHILRIWVYSWIAPGLALFLWAGLCLALEPWAPVSAALLNPWAWSDALARRMQALGTFLPFVLRHHLPGLVLSGLAAGWMFLWCGAACRFYLRLPSGGAVAGAIGLMLLCAALAVQMWAYVLAAGS